MTSTSRRAVLDHVRRLLGRLHPGRTWPFWLAVVTFIAHLPYLWPGGPWARVAYPLVLGQDEGTLLYDALRIAEGDVMYRDFFQFQGPVAYYVISLIYTITGPSIGAARFFHLIIVAATAGMLAVVVARLVAGYTGGLAGKIAGSGAALVHTGLLIALWPFVYAHWVAEAFVFAALVLLTAETVTRKARIWAGVFLALAVFTIQSLGIPALVAALGTASFAGIAARQWRQALLAPGQIALGATITTAVIMVYFALHGALGDMLHAMFVWTRQHYQAGQGDAAYVYGWGWRIFTNAHAELAEPWKSLGVHGIHLIRALPYCTVAAAAIVVPRTLYRMWRGESDYANATVAGVGLAAVSPLLLAFTRMDITHVGFIGSFGLIGAAAFGVFARALRSRDWSERVGRIPVRAVVRPGARALGWLVTAAFIITGLGSAVTYSHKTVITWDESRRYSTWKQRCLVLGGARKIDRLLAPDDTIVVGRMAGFYYMYVRRSASPYTYLPASPNKYYSDEQWTEIADAIIEHRPAALLLAGTQWQDLTARRPELDTIYRSKNGLRMLVEPKPPLDKTP